MEIDRTIRLAEPKELLEALRKMPTFFERAKLTFDAFGVKLPKSSYDPHIMDLYFEDKDMMQYRQVCDIYDIKPFSYCNDGFFRSQGFLPQFSDYLTLDDLTSTGKTHRIFVDFNQLYSYSFDEFRSDYTNLISLGYSITYALFDFGSVDGSQNVVVAESTGRKHENMVDSEDRILSIRLSKKTFEGRESHFDMLYYRWFDMLRQLYLPEAQDRKKQ